MTHNKAVVISRWWAGVLASLLATAVGSAFAFAWSANGQQVATQIQLQVLEGQQRELNKLPERVVRIEEMVRSTDKSMDELKKEQSRMGKQVDLLVETQLDKMRPGR